MSIINGGSTLGFFGGTAPYEISRSLRFNSADSANLSRTFSTPTGANWTLSLWIKRSTLAGVQPIIGTSTTNRLSFQDNVLYIGTPSLSIAIASNAFRDPSAWFHLVISVNPSTAAGTLYINGVATFIAYIGTLAINTAVLHRLGSDGTNYFSGYFADVHFVDGQLLAASDFGETSATTGIWMPKRYAGTYGNNGFKINFSDNSAATSTALGKDTSGRGNDWTPNNFSVAAGVGNDSLVDVPVNGLQGDTGVGGEVRGNYCTWNPLDLVSTTLANGNLQASGSTDVAGVSGTIGVSSGKWYWEVTAGSSYDVIGIWSTTSRVTSYPGDTSSSYGYFGSTGNKINGGAASAYGATFTTNDVIGVALDLDAGTLTFYKNGVSQSTAFSSLAGGFRPAVRAGSASGASTATYLNAGQRPFVYTVPSGFKALCTANLPAPTIVKPSTVMDVVTYTGTGSTLTPTSTLGFNPDLIWIKSRSAATDHALYDSVRGTQARLESNTVDAEVTSDSGVTAFNTAGFTLGTLAQVNSNAATYAAWAWDAGSSTVTNTAGTISSQVRANASAGFSIVTYTGNGVTGATVGHGLGVTPSLVILKRRDVGSTNWYTYHSSIGNTGALALNVTSGTITSGNFWNNTSPTSTVITISATGGGEVNGNGGTFVLYCFAPVAGYSAFGSYTGNGSADGPFVYTGFRPRWLLYKNTAAGNNWILIDTSRDPINVCAQYLYANAAGAEATFGVFDFLSNGFKARTNDSQTNLASNTYVYAAFAESPFSLARAR